MSGEAILFVVAFVLTVLLEWAVLAWFSKLGFARTGWFCLWMNAATWGALNGILVFWPDGVVELELAVIVVEALLLHWYWEWSAGRSLLVSALMNLTSWLMGTMIVDLLLLAYMKRAL